MNLNQKDLQTIFKKSLLKKKLKINKIFINSKEAKKNLFFLQLKARIQTGIFMQKKPFKKVRNSPL